MTGYQDFNHPAFNERATALRLAGFEVINPAELDAEVGTGEAWEFYMKRDIPHLLTCEAVATLPGWLGSRGAKLEVLIAEALGMSVFDAFSVNPPSNLTPKENRYLDARI